MVRLIRLWFPKKELPKLEFKKLNLSFDQQSNWSTSLLNTKMGLYLVKEI